MLGIIPKGKVYDIGIKKKCKLLYSNNKTHNKQYGKKYWHHMRKGISLRMWINKKMKNILNIENW